MPLSWTAFPIALRKIEKASQISTEHDVALAMLNVYDAYNESDSANVASYDFKLASSRAIAQNKTSFSVGDQTVHHPV